MQNVKVVSFGASSETVRMLSGMLAEAKAGRLVGLAYVSMLPCGRWEMGTCGVAAKEPVMALGALQCLKAELIEDALNLVE